MTKPENFEKVILFLADRLGDRPYAIRGTSSLLLQGIDMNVDDIDIVCDKPSALACSTLFDDSKAVGEMKINWIKHVEWSESDKFKSYFGGFSVGEVKVEIMGQWQIKMPNGQWLMADLNERQQVEVEGQKIWVTTIESELKVFAAMGRWNALHKIKKQIEIKKQASLL